MSLTRLWNKIKPQKALENTETISFSPDGTIGPEPLWRKLFLSLVIILVASLSFGIGRLTGGGEREPIRVEFDPSLSVLEPRSGGTSGQTEASAIKALPDPSGSNQKEVVASSKGKKYHYPDCPGAKQISAGNLLVFASASAAEASGYSLAANCPQR